MLTDNHPTVLRQYTVGGTSGPPSSPPWACCSGAQPEMAPWRHWSFWWRLRGVAGAKEHQQMQAVKLSPQQSNEWSHFLQRTGMSPCIFWSTTQCTLLSVVHQLPAKLCSIELSILRQQWLLQAFICFQSSFFMAFKLLSLK